MNSYLADARSNILFVGDAERSFFDYAYLPIFWREGLGVGHTVKEILFAYAVLRWYDAHKSKFVKYRYLEEDLYKYEYKSLYKRFRDLRNKLIGHFDEGYTTKTPEGERVRADLVGQITPFPDGLSEYVVENFAKLFERSCILAFGKMSEVNNRRYEALD